MKIKIESVVLLLAAANFLPVGAATAPAPTPTPATVPTPAAGAATTIAPKIKFEKTVYDFGKVNAGELVRHDFIFTNTGTATLDINDVHPGCGCTTAGTWDKKVEPGKTGSIPLQFNSAGFGGAVTKSATVSSSDPTQPSVVLQITGTVYKPIDITPTMANFVVMADNETNETKTLRIVNHTEEMLTLSDIKCSNPAFKVELKTNTPGKEFEVLVTTLPPFKAPTAYGSISIKTSSTKTPVLNMSAYAQVQQQVMLIPEQVVLPAGPLTNVANLTVSVRNNSSNALAISDAAINLPNARVVVQEMQPGKLFALRATFPVGTVIPPGQRIELTAKTDNPKFPLLKAPVYQPGSPFGPAGPGVQIAPSFRRPTTNAQAVPLPVTAPGRSPLPAVPKN